jgi:hypothetical protein
VVVVERRQENTFFAEGRSAVAGMPPSIFSDRHQDQKKKRKEKEAKRKERIIIFLYIYKRYLKDYYIYIYILVCGERVVHGLVHTLAAFVDSIDV